MIGIGEKKYKFNILYLEEGEIYIKDFVGSIYFYDTVSQSYRQSKAMIHFSSRSLIIELENDNKQPIYKYLYKHFSKEPTFLYNEKYPMKIQVKKLLEIPASSVAKPYKTVDHEYYSLENGFDLHINIQFHRVESFYQGLHQLSSKLKEMKTFHYEQQVDKKLFSNYDFVSQTSFDKTRIKSLDEKALLPQEYRVQQILPLIQIDGFLYLTDKRVYFQPFHAVYEEPVLNYKYKDITQLFQRRFKLMNIGLEIVAGEKSLYLAFETQEQSKLVYNKILQQVGPQCITLKQSIIDYTHIWVNGGMSNFEYLSLLNTYAQRSFQDLTQYPVFPWIIKEYKSKTLNLEDPETFRDLSKPIGAINQKRLKDFLNRYNDAPEELKYMYGTHYSCPGYVIGFMVRNQPQWMIKFQGGRFDNPNRLFKGINKEWNNCNNNPGNLKELIPEFFMSDTNFLVNAQKLDLGVRANQKKVDDVKLPSWASSPEDFLKKHRQALECDHVSNNIHLWIDLIFGSKQRSAEDFNVFHPMTYEGTIELEQLEDPVQRLAFETQITEFGQTPRQLFRKNHPAKHSKVIPKNLLIEFDAHGKVINRDVQQQDKFDTLSSTANQQSVYNNQSQSQISTKEEKKDNDDSSDEDQVDMQKINKSKTKNFKNFALQKLNKAHKQEITSVWMISDTINSLNDIKFVTTSLDGFIKMHDAASGQTKKNFFVCQSGINASCPLSSSESFALAAQNHNVYLFSFVTGTTIAMFYAHDDLINKLLYANDKLVSFSSDQTIKLWDLKGGQNSFDEPEVTVYDHEEEIIDAALHQSKKVIASMDCEGTVIVRDLTVPNEYISRIRHDSSEFQTGTLAFNSMMEKELFVAINQDLYLYHFDGTLIQKRDFSFNIDNIVQDQDCLMISYQSESNDQETTLTCYDWQKDTFEDEYESITRTQVFSMDISSGRDSKGKSVSGDCIVLGTESGSLYILMNQADKK